MKRRYALLAGGCLLLAGQALVISPVSAGGTPRCFGVPATIVEDDGPNTINAGGGRDVIVTRGGNDTVNGGSGSPATEIKSVPTIMITRCRSRNSSTGARKA